MSGGSGNEGTVQTVLGPVPSSDLGITLMHEHVLMDLSSHARRSGDKEFAHLFDSTVGPENIALLRRRPLDVCPDNLRLDNPVDMRGELTEFKGAGGNTVVDCTVAGMGRQVLELQRISRSLGLNIIAGTGFYVEKFHPSWIAEASVSDIERKILADISAGLDGTGVLPGIIGEIGASGVEREQDRTNKLGPFTRNEQKVLRASARASAKSGLALSLHLDRREEDAREVVQLVLAEGASPSKVIVGHMDRGSSLAYELEILNTGVCLQYDGFGREYSFEEIGYRFPPDQDRVARLSRLIEMGYASQLLISQDITFKIDLLRNQGPGYGHLLTNIIPQLPPSVRAVFVDVLLMANPRRVLSI